MDITITHLTKVYRGGVYALQDLSLTIPRGMFGLLGPNGAGKTTLMRILAGILHPSSGDFSIGEHSGGTRQGRQAIKRFLGYVPQELGVYPELNAEEFLTYIAILKGMRQRDTRHQRVRQLLETVSLSQVARRPLKTYSGGMKRRVGIAQALLNDPQLLIVDEPTAGLDPEERIRVRNLLAEVGNERTVLLSTHIVEDIAQTCHRLAVLKDGQIIYEGETSELAKMAHGRVWTLTSSGIKPQGDLVVVSTINQGSSIQYRVIGTPPIEGSAYPAQPTLEDGYVWLMQTSKQPG